MGRSEGFTTRPNDLVGGANPAGAGLVHTSNVIIRRSS